eukprot:m.135922 g.135922  ORF g.135922 m.135922 type:complete len:1072 (+) comp16013_c0_seq1:101-3316(+)
MAKFASFEALCKASEPAFEAYKYETYCRSMPRLLDKARELKSLGQTREAFVLLWRAAFLAAQMQKIPKAKAAVSGAMSTILEVYEELAVLKPIIKASFEPEPAAPKPADPASPEDSNNDVYLFPTVPGQASGSTSSMTEEDLYKLQRERGWDTQVPSPPVEDAVQDPYVDPMSLDFLATPTPSNGATSTNRDPNQLTDLSAEDYTPSTLGSQPALDISLLQPQTSITSETTCSLPLYPSDKLFKNLTRALVLDVRPSSAYAQGHIAGILQPIHECSLPLERLATGMDANKLASLLRGSQRKAFEERDNFDPVVLVTSQGIVEDEELEPLIAALTQYHMGKPLRSPLVLLDGGYQDYHARYAHSCTGPPTIMTSTPDYVVAIDDAFIPEIESIEQEEARLLAEKRSEEQRIAAEKAAQAERLKRAKEAKEAELAREQARLAQEEERAQQEAKAAQEARERSEKAARDREERRRLKALKAERLLVEAKAQEEALRKAQIEAKNQHEKEMAELKVRQAVEAEKQRRVQLESELRAEQEEKARLLAEVETARHREQQKRALLKQQQEQREREISKLKQDQRAAARNAEVERRNMAIQHQAQLDQLAREQQAKRARARKLAQQARRQPKPGARPPPAVSSVSAPQRPSTRPPTSSTSSSSSASNNRPMRAAPTVPTQPKPGSMGSNRPAPRPTVDRSRKPQAALSVRSQPAFRQARLDSMQLVHSSGGALSGLRNLGNTCFMNSILQCLLYTTPLTLYFTQGRFRNDLNRRNPMGCKGDLAEEYAALMVELHKQSYRHLAPRFFKDTLAQFAPQFSGYQQQDAQEFASFLLDGLHEDLNRVRKKPTMIDLKLDGLPDPLAAEKAWHEYTSRNNSIITDVFQGQYRSAIRCKTCDYESVNFSPFMFLTVPLARGSSTSLKACLKELTRAEIVSGNDTWKCPRCKCHRSAVKSLGIWRLPPVLIIHLKRFTFDGPFRDKLQTLVRFPINGLNMREHVMNPELIRQPPTYNLYGISNHYGNMSGGHYIAFAKEPVRQTWHKFDDSAVSRLSESELCTSAAYVLFYTRVDFKALQAQNAM